MSNAADIREIGDCSALLYRETKERARIGPLFGCIAGALDILCCAWWVRLFGRLVIFLCWHLALVNRAGGNDFLLSRWMLSRRHEDRDALITRLSIPGQIGGTLYWALSSLADQRGEFRVFLPHLAEVGNSIHLDYLASGMSKRSEAQHG